MNPLRQLATHGQSFWYDNIRRRYLFDGTLKALIENDGLRGITSNPSIFQSAIAAGDDYDAQLAHLAPTELSTLELYEALALADIRAACDLFLALYRESEGTDGFVSLEVSPHLALDEQRTVAEARRLFAAVDRPNVMIKVPATPQGIPAVRTLIGAGININITLMFSMAHYEAVAQAYLDGLRDLQESGSRLDNVASVASFFVSRVDSAVDRRLSDIGGPAASALAGKAAIANSRVVYQRFKEIFHGESFADLKAGGALVQRLLWASTSTKNPAYPDTLYVDELIGPQTVNTMPPQTVDAFRDHGRVTPTLESGLEEAEELLAELATLGVDMTAVTEELQVDGVKAFASSFDALLSVLAERRAQLAAAIP